MKYHLFAEDVYYAKGGINDYVKSSEDLSELLNEASKIESEKCDPWWHICDNSFCIVKSSKNKP